MTKRNAHALQRRYTKLLARATALTPAVRHLGQGVTARPPWSLGLGMLRRHRCPHGTCQLSHDDSRQVVGLRAGCTRRSRGKRCLWSACRIGERSDPGRSCDGSGSEFSLRRSRTACCADLFSTGLGLPGGYRIRAFERYCERTGISHKQRRILPPSQRSNRLACRADAALVCAYCVPTSKRADPGYPRIGP